MEESAGLLEDDDALELDEIEYTEGFDLDCPISLQVDKRQTRTIFKHRNGCFSFQNFSFLFLKCSSPP